MKIFRDLGLKIIALLIGVLLWFLASIERSYEIYLELPISLGPPDSGYVLTSLPPERIKVSFTGKGSRLIGIRINPPRIAVKLKKKRSGSHTISLSRNDLIPEPGPDVRVRFIPERIRVQLSREYRRYVDLWIPIVGTPKENFVLGAVESPKRVLVSGGKEHIVRINAVTTETLSIEGKHEKFDTMVRIIPPSPLIKTSPESVMVVVDIEACAETTLSLIPIQIDRRTDQLVSIDPERATLRIRGPKSKIRRLKSDEVKIRISVRALARGEFDLPAQITLPAGLKLVSSDPKTFRVRVR